MARGFVAELDLLLNTTEPGPVPTMVDAVCDPGYTLGRQGSDGRACHS